MIYLIKSKEKCKKLKIMLAICRKMSITMHTLKDVYERLAKNPNDRLAGLRFYHSDIHYCRAHINYKFGTDYTLDEMYDLLKEENLI